MKKIIIAYASYGGGHFSAAKNLKEYIEKYYPDNEVILFDFMRYINRIIDKLGQKAYSEITTNIPWLWNKLYYHTQDPFFEKVFTLSNKLVSYKLNKLFKRENPDIIISTHFFAGHICSILKQKNKINCTLSTVITDYGVEPYSEWISGHEYIDYIFVAHTQIKDCLIAKGVLPPKIIPTGIPISLRFLENKEKKSILQALNFEENKKTILFFGGGEIGIGKSNTLDIFKTLISEHSNLQVIAIAGKNEELKNNFEKISLEYNNANNVAIFGFSDKIPELMSISDLVFTKPGGLTTTECLVSNLPMIIINPIPGQETDNADFLVKNGCAIWLQKDDDVSYILNKILNSPNKISIMKDCAKIVAKPNSTKEICEILLS